MGLVIDVDSNSKDENTQTLSRSLSKLDALALAFGAMIGWGWVVMAGVWLTEGGTAGAMLAFVLVGFAVLIIAFIYAELAAAMPKVGGEHVYSLRALGRKGSFFCTWSICFVYIAVCAFEAVALGTVIEYLLPTFKYVYLWTVAGYDIYLSWLLVGVLGSLVVTVINVVGVKMSALFQITMTTVIVLAGIMLVSGTLFSGSTHNLQPLFASGTSGILSVVALVVFYFVGFDVIPQAAEEIDLPPKRMAQMLVAAVMCGVVWYLVILTAISYLMDANALMMSSLPAADASRVAWGAAGAKLLILGGLAGIITSWNGFLVGGSRALFAMANSGMLPRGLAFIHPRYHTPYRAVILIGIIAAVAPFFGRQVLLWITNAAGFGAIIAYALVAISFLVLRKREPEMNRPFKLPFGIFFGWLGLLITLLLGLAYMPGSPGALAWPYEWLILGLWYFLGIVIICFSPVKYG